MSSGFISEKDVAERRRVRQENWEKNRKEDDPLEAPEEAPPDNRSLYDRLQEQRQKKQEEYDEAHKFKNMVRGLEDDEVDFLELVDRSKLQEEKRVRTEESSAMAEYRKKVSAMQKNCAEEEMRAEMRAGEKKLAGGSGKKSHLSLLAGAIKRKHSDEDKTIDDEKASKIPNTSNASNGEKAEIHTSKPSTKSGFQCIAVLPGLGVYTDSSDSDNNVDSDSDEDDTQPQPPQQPRDITGRIVKAPAQCSQSS
ncbi:PSME3-interacting protein isoform X1 [Palaemon carinicauda]|uniref:PSME3-interacting protein isoform X1 n=1 Tax=Palaemon carinicauda TaxID=392227 RepID=UPI0035B69AE9